MANTNAPDGKATNTDDPHGLDVWEVDESDPDRLHDSLDTVAERLAHLIQREATTWEAQLEAGPGQAVSVSDAARVIAREQIRDTRFKHKQAGWQVDAYQKMIDDAIKATTALRATCERVAPEIDRLRTTTTALSAACERVAPEIDRLRTTTSAPASARTAPPAHVEAFGGQVIRYAGESWKHLDGAARIARERRRQVTAEGYDPAHDDRFVRGELANAALVYLDEHASAADWPWAGEWPKRTDRIRDLEKAGGLIAAEIDRLRRQELREGKSQ